jgi:preprotein translocase subunit SecG
MTFHLFIEFLHIVVCLALIGVVMVQASEGEGLSGAFGGGGSYALFGKRGATGFIAKATTAAAVTFMLTSFALAYQVSATSAPGAGNQAGTALPLSSGTTPDTGAPLANQ